MTNETDLKHQDFSFFGKDSKLNGEFCLAGTTHIAAELEGNLYMENNAPLYIDRSGSFKGNIECHDIEVHGQIDGSIKSTGKIVVHPSAHIEGKITSKHLIIFPGANINVDGHTAN